jgi:hypothetical protein
VDDVLVQTQTGAAGRGRCGRSFIVGHSAAKRRTGIRRIAGVTWKAAASTHVGVFCWSPEPGTVSAGMADRVAAAAAAERRDRLMAAQAQASAARLRARKGETTRILLERREKDGWHGRTPWQAPEVDGETVLENAGRGVQAVRFRAGEDRADSPIRLLGAAAKIVKFPASSSLGREIWVSRRMAWTLAPSLRARGKTFGEGSEAPCPHRRKRPPPKINPRRAR